MSTIAAASAMPAITYNFAYLDEQTKRMIRRAILKAIANDPERAMIVIDPRRTETAELADKVHQLVADGKLTPAATNRANKALLAGG